MAYLARGVLSTSTYPMALTWEGQLSVATATYLQIYNRVSSRWDGVATNTSPSANTDFTLSANVSSPNNYIDSAGAVAVRVITGTTTQGTTLRTDRFDVGLLSITTQRAYMFYNDDGADVNSNTPRTGAATSTAITGVRRGERMNVRIQIDNGGSGAATTTYSLQWENQSDSPNVWNDLGTTTQVRTSLSDRGAIYASWGSIPLPTIQVTTACSNGYSYSPGRFAVAFATTTPLSFNPSTCSELQFAIDTGGVLTGKTYRLRLVMGSSTQELDAYAVYPTFSTLSSMTDILEVSKEARGGTTTSVFGISGGTPSLAIGTDGNPLIPYFDSTAGRLYLLRCTNSTCTATSGSMLDLTDASGIYASLAIGTDGNPLIAHVDGVNFDLRLLRCTNSTCTATSGSMLEGVGDVGNLPSLAIGADGNPLVAHSDSTVVDNSDLRLLRCTNSTCTATSGSMLEGVGDVGQHPSLTLGINGNPLIAHYDPSNFNLRLLRCNNSSCTATSGVLLENTAGSTIFPGVSPSIAIDMSGNPIITHQDDAHADLRLLRCTNSSCTATSGSMLEGVGSVGSIPSLTIGTDGNSLIAHTDIANLDLRLLRCSNTTCTATSGSMLEGVGDVGGYPSLAIGTDGNPLIAHGDSTLTGLYLLKCNSIDCSSTGATANMNSSTTLRKLLDNKGYERILSSDDTRDSLEGSANVRMAYQARMIHGNNTDPLTLSWEGQLSVATATYLQIYNRASSRWDGVATNTSPSANTDFTLSNTISTPTNYYDADNGVVFRVITGTTTLGTTLQTDALTASAGAASTALEQVRYRWRNDNGTEIQASAVASENTALSSGMFVGDRTRLRIQVRETAGVTASSYRYRLEVSSSTCTVWVGVPMSQTFVAEHWIMDESQYVANASLTTNVASMLTDPTGSFVSGYFSSATGTPPSLSVTANNFTELEYSIRSTQYVSAGTLYCFRVTNDGSTSTFTYTVQPQVTISGGQRPVVGGSGVETGGAGSVRSGGSGNGGGGSESGGSGSGHGGGGSGGGGGLE